ncbi:MAG TPA: hypothetical protein VKY40_03665 [Halanaerobiales bacterium]|nr:hypothetical protein [Halanaerobiales bacterium]
MKMHKEKIKKEDGRYLIYYSFEQDEDFAREARSGKGGNESAESGKSNISKGGGADV